MGNITICSVVKVLIVLLLLAALVVYGAVANYRLKQLSCATNSGPVDTFIHQILNRYSFGLYGFIAGQPHKDDKFVVAASSSS